MNAPLWTDIHVEKELHFKNYNRSQRVRFTVYVDFESILSLIKGPYPDPKQTYSMQNQKHLYRIIHTLLRIVKMC